jgi:hypothetical protein
MKLLVSKWSGFYSVPDPYIRDRFVSQTHELLETSFDLRQKLSSKFLKSVERSQLARIVRAMKDSHLIEDEVLNVIDGGVFMGVFSIATNGIAQMLSLSAMIEAYEMSAMLKESILANFSLHQCPVCLEMCGIGEHDSESANLYFRDDGLIGASAIPSANVSSTTFAESSMKSLSSILKKGGIRTSNLIKLDLEGHEPNAFKSLLSTPELLRNIFIIEYSAWQGKRDFSSSQKSWAEFLCDNFYVFNLQNWISSKPSIQVSHADGLLDDLETGSKVWNTDILLIPRQMEAMLDSYVSLNCPEIP